MVSTHSRPKAAGSVISASQQAKAGFQHTAARRRLVPKGTMQINEYQFQHTAARRRLDPNGSKLWRYRFSFNTQPPEGGWRFKKSQKKGSRRVSTHSRPKAAGSASTGFSNRQTFCFNTQPPEGGWTIHNTFNEFRYLFQHTAARRRLDSKSNDGRKTCGVSTHSRPKAAGS